jgi:hypothetical protein
MTSHLTGWKSSENCFALRRHLIVSKCGGLSTTLVELGTMLGWDNKVRSDIGEPCPSSPCSALPEWEGSEGCVSIHAITWYGQCVQVFTANAFRSGRGDMYCGRRLFIFVVNRSIVGEPHRSRAAWNMSLCGVLCGDLTCSIWKGCLPVCNASPICVVGRERTFNGNVI